MEEEWDGWGSEVKHSEDGIRGVQRGVFVDIAIRQAWVLALASVAWEVQFSLPLHLSSSSLPISIHLSIPSTFLSSFITFQTAYLHTPSFPSICGETEIVGADCIRYPVSSIVDTQILHWYT